METLKKILLISILIRILLMPFLFHPDIRVYHSQAQYLKDGVVDIYSYLDATKEERHFKEEFVYFPLAYLTLGSYQALVDPLLGDNFENWLMGEDSLNLYRYLFLLKLPYLVLDIAIAFLLYKLVDKSYKKAVFILWLFNPFSLMLIYGFSNIDIFSVFFSVLALLLVKQKRSLHAGVSIAVGALFKAFPLVFLPVLLLTDESIKKKLTNVLISLSVFVFGLLPFWNESFLSSAFSSGLTNRIFEYGINLGLPNKLPYYLILLGIVFLILYIKKLKNFTLYFFAAAVLLVAFVDYHIQWILWFLPFLIVLVSHRKSLIILALTFAILAFIPPILIDDKYLSVGILSPISPIFLQASTPYLFLSNYLNPESVREVFRGLFLMTAIFVTYLGFNYKNENI